jgi:hypothetical protein
MLSCLLYLWTDFAQFFPNELCKYVNLGKRYHAPFEHVNFVLCRQPSNNSDHLFFEDKSVILIRNAVQLTAVGVSLFDSHTWKHFSFTFCVKLDKRTIVKVFFTY